MYTFLIFFLSPISPRVRLQCGDTDDIISSITYILFLVVVPLYILSVFSDRLGPLC
jgi:hypothetical protein